MTGGWWWWWCWGGVGAAAYGSSGWQLLVVLVKNFVIFFYQNELKSPEKQHVFLLFFSIKGDWVGGSDRDAKLQYFANNVGQKCFVIFSSN